VNGAPIEVFEADSQSLPEPGVAAAQQLVDVNNVVAIVGPAGSTVAVAVAESVTVPANVLVVSPSATGAAISEVADNDLLFRTTISDLAQGIVLADLVEEDLGIQSVCAMYVNNAYGQGLAEEFEASYGGTVTAAVAHEEEGITFLSEVQQCVAGGPEALLAMSYTTGQADVYLQEAIENNLIDNFVFVDGTKDAKVFSTLGWENFDGMWGTAPGALPPEFGRAFDEMYTGEYGELYTIPYVKEAYDAVVAIALAAELADTNTDALAIRDSLREVSNAPGTQYGPGEDDLAAAMAAVANGEDIDLTGASGALEFDEAGDVLFGAIEIWQIQGEEIVSVRTVTVDLATGEMEVIGGDDATTPEEGDADEEDGGAE
jgi:branched-chain amino acid transport system substrate-binding protein